MKLSDLGRKSIRRNALIADLLHRITFIEKAGTGIKHMRKEAHDQRCPAPIFEKNGFFTAIFYPNPEVRAEAGSTAGLTKSQSGPNSGPSRGHDPLEAPAHVPDMYPASTPQVTHQVGTKSGLSKDQVQILDKCMYDSQIGELMELAGRTNRTKFRDQVLNPLLEAGFIEMTVPEKPNSSKQRYRTTAAGRAILEKHEKEAEA